MAETKKLPVAYNPKRPNSRSSDFVAPREREGQTILVGLKTGKEHSLGMMVYLGRSVTENDLFAKLVESGTQVPDVDDALDSLRRFIDELKGFKIGNIIRAASVVSSLSGARLELVANTPSGLADC